MRKLTENRTIVSVGALLLLLLTLCIGFLGAQRQFPLVSWWSEDRAFTLRDLLERSSDTVGEWVAGLVDAVSPERPPVADRPAPAATDKNGPDPDVVADTTEDDVDAPQAAPEDPVIGESPDSTGDLPGEGVPGVYRTDRSQSSPRLAIGPTGPGSATPRGQSRGSWGSGGGFGYAGGGSGGFYAGGGFSDGSSGDDFYDDPGAGGDSRVMLAYNQMGGGMPSGNTFYDTMFSQPMGSRPGNRNNEAQEPDPPRPPGDDIDWSTILLPGADGCYGPFFSPLSAAEQELMLLNIEMGCENEYEDTLLDIVENTNPPSPTPGDERDPSDSPYVPGPDGCYGPFFSPIGPRERQLMILNREMGCDNGDSSSSSSSSSTGGFSSSSSSSGGFSSSSGGLSSSSTSSSGVSTSSTSGGWSSSSGSSTSSSGWSSSSGSSTSSSGTSTSSAGTSTSSAGTFTSSTGTSTSSSGGTIPLPGTFWLVLGALVPLGMRWSRRRR